MKPKYEIGQAVFFASFSSHASEYVTCPDCGGTARLRVTFHDETTVSIPCQNCARGYNDPRGQISVYCRRGEAKQARISGVEVSDGKVEYRAQYYGIGDDGRTYTGCNYLEEDKVFLTEAEAQLAADQLAADYDAEERAKVFKKEKDHRSWAWNASYHRKCIKDAQDKIAHHTAKLNVAALKAKQEKKGELGSNGAPECA